MKIVDESHIEEWPGEERLKHFFSKFVHYQDEIPSSELVDNESHNKGGLGNAVRISGRERISLSRKNWKDPMRERHIHFLNWQGAMIRDLMKAIYRSHEDIGNKTTNVK